MKRELEGLEGNGHSQKRGKGRKVKGIMRRKEEVVSKGGIENMARKSREKGRTLEG